MIWEDLAIILKLSAKTLFLWQFSKVKEYYGYIRACNAQMGESIMEATILSWAKNIGDHIDVDESILEIATDKVDSEIRHL